MKHLSRILIAICFLTGPAHAATITFTSGETSSVASAVTFQDFDGVNNTSVATFLGGRPDGGNNPRSTFPNHWIGADLNGGGSENVVTVFFAKPASYVGFLWGSPQAAQIERFTVLQIGAKPGDPNTLLARVFNTPPGANYVNIFAGPGEQIDVMLLIGGGFLTIPPTPTCCFEADNFTYIAAALPTPVPGVGLPGLVIAGCLLGWLRRRQHVTEASIPSCSK